MRDTPAQRQIAVNATRPTLALTLIVLLLAALAMGADGGCVPVGSEDASGATNFDPDGPDFVSEGVAALEHHDVQQAREHFAFASTQGNHPRHGEAVVGQVVTELMLMPEWSSTGGVISALGGRPVDMQRDVYGPEGLLALTAAHVEDRVVENHLDAIMPWTGDDLSQPELIFGRLQPGTSVNDVLDKLVIVAHDLVGLADRLAEVSADPAFTAFTVRGDAFFARTTLRLTRPELMMLEASLRATASMIFWVTAYDWNLDLHDDLSDAVPLDARVDRFNAVAFRALRPEATELLAQSRAQLLLAVDGVRRTIVDGPDNPHKGNLRWEALSDREVADLETTLAEVSAAMGPDGPVLLSNAAPEDATLDLRPLFAGRTLPAERNLVRHAVDEFGDGSWELDWDGVAALWIEGVLDPSCNPDPDLEDTCLSLFADEVVSDRTFDAVADPFISSVESDYNIAP